MIEGVVFTALRGLVADRCYPNTFMQPDGDLPTWPAIRYQVTGASNAPDIDGTGASDTDDTTVTIDVVAKTHGAAVALRDQVIAALQYTDPPCTRDEGGFQTFDEETKTNRITLQFTFYASSVAGSP